MGSGGGDPGVECDDFLKGDRLEAILLVSLCRDFDFDIRIRMLCIWKEGGDMRKRGESVELV